MAIKKKSRCPKVLIAISLVVILAIASAALVYVSIQSASASKQVVPGVHVGDTFTYALTGDSILYDTEAVTPASLYYYNETSYYEVIITAVNGFTVSFNTIWAFTNGTSIQNSDWINLETGNYSGDFWAIYPPNLNVNDRLYPKEANTALIVNSTGSQPFAAGNRTANYWSIEKEFTNPSDPTGSSTMVSAIDVYFDKQTGMLEYLDDAQDYNNPQYNIIITWQLTNSTVWNV
jgi:hypothetical protein